MSARIFPTLMYPSDSLNESCFVERAGAMIRLLPVALCATMLAGCVSGFVGGNRDKINASYAKQHLIVGKTTKAEVRQLFGEPSPTLSSVSSNGEEDWVYTTDKGTNVLSAASDVLPVAVPALSSAAYIASSNQGAQGSQLLSISFNARGVVRQWRM